MKMREMREKKGLTQQALAKLIGIRQQSIQAIEAGKAKPAPETAEAIRKVFGISYGELWAMFYGGGGDEAQDHQ